MPQGEGGFPQREEEQLFKGEGGRELNCLRSNFSQGATFHGEQVHKCLIKKIQRKTLSKSNNLYIIEKLLKHKIIKT